MKISYIIDKVKKNNRLNIAFGVSKDILHPYSEIGKATITCLADSFPNQNITILEKLQPAAP
jgi:hypothetical protein